MDTKYVTSAVMSICFIITAIGIPICLVCQEFGIRLYWLEIITAISFVGIFATYMIIYPLLEFGVWIWKHIKKK